MTHRTENPSGAKALLDGPEGWTFVDVRSVAEFAASHVSGAYNVPVMEPDPSGRMAPNPEFVTVMKKHFPTDARLVLGCAAGMRSKHACELLAASGYGSLVNMHGGFSGYREPTGQMSEPGWEACGFPCESASANERTYATLRQ